MQPPEIYAYVGNDPTDKTDPTGLLVDSLYDPKSGLLYVVDMDTGEMAAATHVTSGGNYLIGSFSRVPDGAYDILEQGQRPGWFRLESRDNNYGDDHTPDGRGQFRLHPGSWSEGCITLTDKREANNVTGLIGRTRTTTSTVRAQHRNPFAAKTETLKNYGFLRVGGNLSLHLDAKTGVLSAVWSVTGSRIPQKRDLCTMKDGTCK